MIVTAASGYVAGTYLSTVTIASVLTTATTTIGIGAAALTGAAGTIIGSAGIFGTTIGASGLTGYLMSVGILSATPIALPVGILAASMGASYLWYVLFKLKRKLRKAGTGVEVIFTDFEARIVEALVKLLSKEQA